MSALEYPVDFPLDAVTNVVTTLRSGQASANLPQLAFDLWTVQGYAQRQLIGVPGEPVAPNTALASQAAADPLAMLEAIAQGSAGAQAVIDWASLLTWALQELVKLVGQHTSGTSAG